MQAVLIAVVSFVGFLVAYHTYGRYLARKIFRLNPQQPCACFRASSQRVTPAARGR